ncbi:hypothetical protein [Acinetobacter bouvetii]|nr:hypothetical protein [Acinetobacter bouvetii]QXW25943.1 hypothetical protein KXJ74_17205 [Acinetobacter johnsonii]
MQFLHITAHILLICDWHAFQTFAAGHSAFNIKRGIGNLQLQAYTRGS